MQQLSIGLEPGRPNAPAPPEDRIEGSDQNAAGSAAAPNAGIDMGESVESMISERMAEHNDEHGNDPAKKATEGQLKAVARRAMGAYSKSHREGVSRQAWASGRIDAYLHLLAEGEPENPDYVQDNDLLPSGHPKSTRENPEENFHVAKIAGAQEDYEQYRRDDDTTFGRGVHALYGIKDEEGPRGGQTELVSLHYPAGEWNAANARRHANGMEDFSIGAFHKARENAPRTNPPNIERLEVGCSDLVLTDSTSYDEEYSTEKEYEIPGGAQEAAQEALEWKKEGADGMHETGMRRTLQLAQGCPLSRAEMEDIRDWFAKKEHEQKYHEIEDGEPTASLVSWQGWGGDEMRAKANEVTDEPANKARDNPMTRGNPMIPGMESFSDVQDSLDGEERENPPSGTATKEDYPGIFSDYDSDNIPTADDPDPLTPGNTETIEEVGLADEMEKILDVQQEYDDVRRATASDLKAEGLGKVQSRTKTPYSIINKLRRKRIGGEKGITDVAGTRLIVPDYDALEQATDMIDDGELGTVIEKENHYKSEGNPYSAVHYIVRRGGKPVEIQVITERVKKIAGAAHTPYKEGNLNADRQRELTQMATRADKGDQAAAEKLKPILEDEGALEAELTQRSNPQRGGSKTGALAALLGAVGFKYVTSQ
jgi:ppGpp synthetase/RelA/SpoT-type nucleotidyltranferase